ncbi:uncharacterized protein VDAG_07572 [Verticillium dahliae VdLs.17]|uniref:Uncharacterized protein n=1 Tax=Verticillium dahliae (strain VdLs.17 / ATCC MYA-4575 / FGSC 10137) TaxID=498257 RepID=G2XBZ4_VERDV|nr:uncharacterized protein VDAG_07572 [Verticillium dahliae VdLs.17]EGY16408.1 hypothetical protein VDAG_07572 [Verticillium dahliae VdLs.17]
MSLAAPTDAPGEDPVPPPPPSPITFVRDVEPFVPTPLIADLLRTRYCIPDSIFLVEGIESAPLTPSSRWRVVRLMLGDGELCIQALLVPEMHRFVDTGSVTVGSYVKLPKFATRRMQITTQDGKGRQKMVYLVVSDIIAVGWHNTLREAARHEALGDDDDDDDELAQEEQQSLTQRQSRGLSTEGDEEDLIADSDIEFGDVERVLNHAQALTATTPTRPRVRGQAARSPSRYDGDSDDEAAFETMTVTPTRSTQRRERLANTIQASASAQVSTLPKDSDLSPSRAAQGRGPPGHEDKTQDESNTNVQKVASPSKASRAQAGSQRPPVALARQWTDTSIPLKLTPLRAINSLPYKQNWSINVLAIVTALSGIEPSHIPPYQQRIARLADPSTDKHVMLACMLEPKDFSPRVGSAVLLVSVKNHLFDGGSLKKYISDKPTTQGGQWWFQNPSRFAWCDAEGLQKWWDELEAARKNKHA